jgi:dTDP-4-dehydrorhamnose reductase
MRIAVVGARGQLGAAVVEACRGRHEALPLDRAALDITRPSMVRDVMARLEPDAIINCAGYNAVDAAEEHPAEALAVNAIAVRTLATEARRVGAALVHYSTDFVFAGLATAPMGEEYPTRPASVYAASKLVGEWFALDAAPAYVLRVESLFGEVAGATPKGSVAAIVTALTRGDRPRVFLDRVVSPTYVFDAAAATLMLLESGADPGLYHCVNSGYATWLEVAEEAARLLAVEPRFEVVRFEDAMFAAVRPKYCALSNAKLRAAGAELPPWQDALARYLAR